MVNKNNKNNNKSTSKKTLKKNINTKNNKLKNKKGGGSINDVYQNDEYKDTGFLDSLKFDDKDILSGRNPSDIPPPPPCTIL